MHVCVCVWKKSLDFSRFIFLSLSLSVPPCMFVYICLLFCLCVPSTYTQL